MKTNRPPNKKAEFTWIRKRLFDFECTLVLYEKCIEAGQAQVLHIIK